MPFKYNPITNQLDITSTSSGPGSGILTINSISPDGGGNFLLTEGANITLTPEANGLIIASTGGASGITTVDGDESFATGSTISIFAGVASQNCGSSVEFVGNGTTVLELNVTDTNNNTIVGKSSGNGTLSGSGNSSLGSGSLTSLTFGSDNTSAGFNSLSSCTEGQNNSGFGKGALNSLTTGTGNTSLGDSSLSLGTVISENSAVGFLSLGNLTTGVSNCSLGVLSGGNLLTGSSNAYFGYQAGLGNVAAENSNVYINSLGTTESNTLRIGRATGIDAFSLSHAFISGINGNTLSGTPLVVTIDSATDQLGVAAFPSGGSVSIETDSGTASGSSLTLKALNGADNCGSTVKFTASGTAIVLNVTDGNVNTFVGLNAGNSSLSGDSNTGLGGLVLNSLTSGSGNLAIGYRSLQANTSGSQSMALGLLSMYQLNSGAGQNVGVGYATLANSTSAEFSTAIGLGALINSNGQYNVAIGHEAAQNVTTGNYDLYFGRNAGSANIGSESSNIYFNSSGANSESNSLRLGAGTGSGDRQLAQAFISGINGNTLGTPSMVVIDAFDQLGVQAIPESSITWISVTSSTQAISASMGYFCNNASSITFTLPASSTAGDSFRITGGQSGAAVTPWVIDQNAGQQINFGNLSSSVGVSGSVASTLKYDSVELVCTVGGSNSVWNILDSIGTLLVT